MRLVVSALLSASSPFSFYSCYACEKEPSLVTNSAEGPVDIKTCTNNTQGNHASGPTKLLDGSYVNDDVTKSPARSLAHSLVRSFAGTRSRVLFPCPSISSRTKRNQTYMAESDAEVRSTPRARARAHATSSPARTGER